MENAILEFLIEIEFVLLLRVLSLHQCVEIISFVPEANMGIVGEPIVIRDT